MQIQLDPVIPGVWRIPVAFILAVEQWETTRTPNAFCPPPTEVFSNSSPKANRYTFSVPVRTWADEIAFNKPVIDARLVAVGREWSFTAQIILKRADCFAFTRPFANGELLSNDDPCVQSLLPLLSAPQIAVASNNPRAVFIRNLTAPEVHLPAGFGWVALTRERQIVYSIQHVPFSQTRLRQNGEPELPLGLERGFEPLNLARLRDGRIVCTEIRVTNPELAGQSHPALRLAPAGSIAKFETFNAKAIGFLPDNIEHLVLHDGEHIEMTLWQSGRFNFKVGFEDTDAQLSRIVPKHGAPVVGREVYREQEQTVILREEDHILAESRAVAARAYGSIPVEYSCFVWLRSGAGNIIRRDGRYVLGADLVPPLTPARRAELRQLKDDLENRYRSIYGSDLPIPTTLSQARIEEAEALHLQARDGTMVRYIAETPPQWYFAFNREMHLLGDAAVQYLTVKDPFSERRYLPAALAAADLANHPQGKLIVFACLKAQADDEATLVLATDIVRSVFAA